MSTLRDEVANIIAEICKDDRIPLKDADRILAAVNARVSALIGAPA